MTDDVKAALNDDVKAAADLWRETSRKCHCLDCRAARTILAYIDGELERRANARAEERALIVDALRRRAWLMGNATTRDALLVAAGRIEDRKHLPRSER